MEKGENSINNQSENDVVKSTPETDQNDNIETPNSGISLPLSSVRMEDQPQSRGEGENIQNEEEEVLQTDQNQPINDKKEEENEEDSDEMDGRKKDETNPSDQDGSGKRPLPLTGNLFLDILLMADPLNLGGSLPSQNKGGDVKDEEDDIKKKAPQPDQNQPVDDKKEEENEEDSDEMDGKKKDETNPSDQDGSGKRPLPLTGNPFLDILLMADPLKLGGSLPSQNEGGDEKKEEENEEKSSSSQNEEEDGKGGASQEPLSETMSKAMLELMETKTFDDFLMAQTLLSPDILNLFAKKSENSPNNDENNSESKEEKETEKGGANEEFIQKVLEVIYLTKRIVIILSFS